MGKAYEIVSGRAVNPGAAFTALTPSSGASFAVRSADMASGVMLDAMWAKGGTAGAFRIRSPRLHDNVQGIKYNYLINAPRDWLYGYQQQPLEPQDVLIPEITGGAAETDTGYFGIYYNNLPGIDARLSDWPSVSPRIRNILTVQVAVAGAATLGDWSAGTALNATQDLLKANVDYALLGYTTDTQVGALAVPGADTGHLKVGGPGTTEAIETWAYFVEQSQLSGRPYIPVINAANKQNTLVFQQDNLAGATVNAFLSMAELAS
jgi:hypothetical protein